MPSTAVLLSQAFNGLALGSLLALVSSGLTIILGTLGVLNFAHGALFAVGAYTAFVMVSATHSFLLALLGGCAVMLIIGFAIERLVIRHFYARPDEDQILVTYGIGIVLVEALRAWFGGNSQRVPVPSWGVGATKLGFLVYPTYRLQLIGIVAAILVSLYLVLYRTAIGLVVCGRASRMPVWSASSASTCGAPSSSSSPSASSRWGSQGCSTPPSSR